MKRFSHFKIGDTLVEVALAIGIFSMVAIAVVSVVSGSSSSTQAALETTITREEIDSQAEALRFIHAAYNAGGELGGSDSEEARYESIWRAITEKAIDITELSDDSSLKEIITNFKPSTSSGFSTCSVLYDDKNDNDISIFKQNAFIINPRALSSGNADDVVIRANGSSSDKFKAAATYPRLIYNNDSNALFDDTSGNVLESAQGIYIVAVKDPNSTIIISDKDGGSYKQDMSAYYDFYIHTCWYNPNEELPSTISTVVRLYDPDTVSTNEYSRSVVTIKFEGNGATSGGMPTQSVLSGRTTTLLKNKFERNDGLVFIGWDANNDGEVDFNDGGNFTAESGLTLNTTVQLKAVWGYRYTLTYYDTDNTTVICMQEGLTKEDSFTFNIKEGTGSATPDNGNSIGCPNTIALTMPSNSQSEFRGWATNTEGSGDWYTTNGRNDTKSSIVATRGAGQNINLYPVWRVVIAFNEQDWTKSGSSVTESCPIFHVNEPSSGSYCKIKKGEKYCEEKPWYSYSEGVYAVPEDGYLVKYAEHIETYNNGKSMNFQGYCYRAGDEGIQYSNINQDDTFELSFRMDTTGMITHPGGYVEISIGPLKATITDGGIITATCQEVSANTSFTSGDKIKLMKYGDDYSITIGDKMEPLKECTVPNHDDGGGKINVNYRMKHKNHSCEQVFNVQLTDINMTQVKE